mmetsp:Transcript_6804/g.11684  ORF Transcript_6804/g.11684 Transcript_6804/m.11684 type:complete len:270 (+) Transcript_6804:1302-2111(+)
MHVGVLPPLLFDVVVPGRLVRLLHSLRLVLGEDLVQERQRRLDVAHDRHVGDLVLVNFCRVDVDVNDLGVLGELFKLAGDTVVEADAKCKEEVRVMHRVVRVHRPVHSEHLERLLVGHWEGAESHESLGHRDSSASDQLTDLVGGVEGAASNVQDWFFGLSDGEGDLFHVCSGGRGRKLVPFKIHGVRPDRGGQLLLDIFGNIDEYRSRPTGFCDMESGLDHPRNLVDGSNQMVVFRYGPSDFHDGSFLKGILPYQMPRHLPGNTHEWN